MVASGKSFGQEGERWLTKTWWHFKQPSLSYRSWRSALVNLGEGDTACIRQRWGVLGHVAMAGQLRGCWISCLPCKWTSQVPWIQPFPYGFGRWHAWSPSTSLRIWPLYQSFPVCSGGWVSMTFQIQCGGGVPPCRGSVLRRREFLVWTLIAKSQNDKSLWDMPRSSIRVISSQSSGR